MAGPDGPAPSAAGTALFDRAAERRLLVVSGKGGVGRTTVAALLGLALARRGRRVLVATTGHDDRLAWMLGARELTTSPISAAERLDIIRLVPQVCIREYGALVLHSQRLSGAVFDNAVVRRLLRAIPGLDDFSLIGKVWHEAVRARSYDCVVFDGPATGHLVYTLGVPQAILNTVPKGPLTKEADYMQRCFEDPNQVEAVLVGLPELWPLTELGELEDALAARIKMSVAGIVVNALWPSGLPRLEPDESHMHTIADETRPQVRAVFDQVDAMALIGRRHREAVDAWLANRRANGKANRAVLEIPWRWHGLTDLRALESLLDELQADPSVVAAAEVS